MLDAHANEALCDCDSVLGDELLEGHEEAGLNGNATRDCGSAVEDQHWGVRMCGLTHSVRSFLERA